MPDSSAAGTIPEAPPALGWSKTVPLSLLVLVTGIGSLAIPTLYSLAAQHWSTSNGAHGPLILVSGIWLVWRERATLRMRSAPRSWAWIALLMPLLLAYAFGRSFDLLGTESAALFAILVLLGFYFWGADAIRRLWFPILYLAFLIKPPFGMVAELTQPLKIALSSLSVAILHALDYPVAQSGVVIQIGQYELLVRQACAGLGSLLTLLAVGLLYVHLARPSGPVRAILLLLAIVPIAIAANLLRIILLLLVTYHFGDAIGQSLVHDAAGMLTFCLSLGGMLLFDRVLDATRVGHRR